jgi:hypothetical protein
VDGVYDIFVAAPNAILAINTKVKGLKLGYDGYADVSKAFYNAT